MPGASPTGMARKRVPHPPGADLFGTDYVDDGGIGNDHDLGGAFEIQDPRGVAPAMYAPLLGFAMPGRPVGPRQRKLILPAQLPMSVVPLLARGTRCGLTKGEP